MAQFHQVELITRNGNALYLMHVRGGVMEWTSDAEQALTYDDLDEAETDAKAYGGEVSSFESPYRGRYPESLYAGEPPVLQSAVIAFEAMKSIAGLVFEAGGDPEYAETWIEGISNDIELSFQSAREPVVTPVFRPRRGLGLVVGVDMRGRP